MKDKEKNAAEEVKIAENGAPLTDEQLKQVTGGKECLVDNKNENEAPYNISAKMEDIPVAVK